MEKVEDCEIPTQVFRRCVGKQSPYTPHAQRLLVASLKAAKAEGGGKLDPNGKPQPKEKATAKKPKSKASPKKKKQVDGDETVAAKPKQPKQKTPYALAKDAYMLKFLGGNNP